MIDVKAILQLKVIIEFWRQSNRVLVYASAYQGGEVKLRNVQDSTERCDSHCWRTELRLLQDTTHHYVLVHVECTGVLAVRRLAVREDLPEENTERPSQENEKENKGRSWDLCQHILIRLLIMLLAIEGMYGEWHNNCTVLTALLVKTTCICSQRSLEVITFMLLLSCQTWPKSNRLAGNIQLW